MVPSALLLCVAALLPLACGGDANGNGRGLVEAARSTQWGAQLERPKAGFMLPLEGKSGVRARGLLRNGTLPIQGAVREVG
jgi:hypothetical protein